MTPEQAQQLAALFQALFYGGGSCGDYVSADDSIPAGTAQNGLMSQVQHLHRAVDRLEKAVAALQPVGGVAAHTHEGGTSGPVAVG